MFHQLSKYPSVGRDSGSCSMLQRSFQCCGLTGLESCRTFDGPVGLVFFHQQPFWNSLASFLACLSDFPSQRFNRWLVVTPERDSPVSKLINESRCSLCDQGELCSLSRNQHCPRHLVSPFADDQHGRHVPFRFCPQETRSPLTRAALHPSRLEQPTSCVVRSRLSPSHRTCT